MTYIYNRIIRVQDTDATGALYFANQLQIALEAFEDFLQYKNFSLQKMVEDQNFLLPIVHSEADYAHPIHLGDALSIHLQVFHIGTSSFTYQTVLYKKELAVGKAAITHVVYAPQAKASQPISDAFRKILQALT